MIQIPSYDLVPMDLFLENEPITIDLVYTDARHPRNIFETKIYHDEARLWAHKDLAAITLIAARILHQRFHYTLELKDSLRTVECQQAMQETDIVRAHPEWCAEGPNRLLSPPGRGGHPRAMAIDICILDENNNPIDMGTEFDEMTEKSARNFDDLPQETLRNRQLLKDSMVIAAKTLNHEILPLPSEWWDFRFYPEEINRYEPLYDSDLPPQMQMQMHKKTSNNIPDLPDTHFEDLKNTILKRIENLHDL